MTVRVRAFGAGAKLFTLQAHGIKAELSDYGAALVGLHHPDGTNVVLGLGSGAAYQDDSQYMGVIAGRYANRIACGRFTLDGQSWQLACNEGRHHLHGGPEGFSRRLWRAETSQDENEVCFRLTSPHLDQGYPGNLEASVRYLITDEGRLRLELKASADRPSLVNLAPHGYFNLTGRPQPAPHLLRLHAGHYTPVDAELIPTGRIRPVDGTPFDYRSARRLDPDMDMNFVIDGAAGTLRPAAELIDPASGRRLLVRASAPGLQVYGGKHLAMGGRFPAHAGLCLEPQYFPDSPNQPAFTAPVIGPGRDYGETIEYDFAPAAGA
ncbi:MAG: galactose-1-epimerase [Hyphomicrobiales bacterium]|nr:MAG: galactose-1-epimerase [Hyphomicrobiales bacterium]